MTGSVVAGFDGSPESLAATAWAAREARLRGLPLTLLQAWPWPKRDVVGSDEVYRHSQEQLAARQAELQAAHPGLPVTSAQVRTDPAESLENAGRDAALLVLGSRGLGAVHGFLVGSVSQEVLTRAACPVVLVRAGDDADADTDAVLAGLDLAHPADEVLAFAFETASARSAPLRIVHAWTPPAGGYLASGSVAGELSAVERTRLTEVLAPWRARYPRLGVTADLVRGSASVALVDASATARLLVVGRRTRRLPLGARLGPVAHAALHHARCPVAVVPHA